MGFQISAVTAQESILKNPPSNKSKFCTAGHNRSNILDLRDLVVLDCNSNIMGMIAAKSGIPDVYLCAHCLRTFEMVCIHAIL